MELWPKYKVSAKKLKQLSGKVINKDLGRNVNCR